MKTKLNKTQIGSGWKSQHQQKNFIGSDTPEKCTIQHPCKDCSTIMKMLMDIAYLRMTGF